MRVVFFGSDAIAVPAVEYLHWADNVELVAIVSQPDRPAGRGRHLHANPMAAWAVAHGVALLQPEKPGPEDAAWLRAQRLDLALVMAYGHILKRELLEVAARGLWNLHASLLPKYRGASPIEAALVSGDLETGVSLMAMTEKMDAGAVAATVKVSIRATDTSPVLRERIAQSCVDLLRENFARLGKIEPQSQDDAQATYTRKLAKTDARLDFSATAAELERRVRAFQPWPGAALEHRGAALKIGAAEVVPGAVEIAPGTIVRADKAGLDIATGADFLRVLSLQRPGGRMLPVAEFLCGYPLEIGERFPSQPMRPLVSSKPFAKAG
ncbi:MAG TPA: methionyl-tRNA formyltransferase [Opitutales bacterium]|nr:methionyl-tRNA formyltransferase [Opitutales bacterium]